MNVLYTVVSAVLLHCVSVTPTESVYVFPTGGVSRDVTKKEEKKDETAFDVFRIRLGFY